MPSIYYSTDFFNIEANLPILLILVNDRKNISYEEQYKHIYENQQNFIISLFNKINSKNRNPDKYKNIGFRGISKISCSLITIVKIHLIANDK